MKSPQGREAKKPKKPKGKTTAKILAEPNRNAFQVPQSEGDSDPKKS